MIWLILFAYIFPSPWISKWLIKNVNDCPTVGNFVFYAMFWPFASAFVLGSKAADKLERYMAFGVNEKLERWLRK